MHVRFLLADYLYISSSKEICTLLQKDMDRICRWDDINGRGVINKLNYCLKYKKEFRNIFYYRISNKRVVLIKLCKLLCFRSTPTIEIGGEIGGGLYISHYNAVVFPKKAGKNLRIGPGCVIGRNSRGFPVIGDNVYIGANSSIIGDIQIGNNVIIGAGSVVTNNVPDNVVYAGNPARCIKRIDDDPDLLNEIL